MTKRQDQLDEQVVDEQAVGWAVPTRLGRMSREKQE